MKIAIIGAGAMGCLYGAFLSKDNRNQVTLIDLWQEHMDAINSHGLTVEDDKHREQVGRLIGTTRVETVGKVDLVLVFVKSLQTQMAIKNSKILFGPKTLALTLQNGLGNVEDICEAVGAERVLAGITAQGATMMGPGVVRHAGYGKTIIGELTGEQSDRVHEIKGVFDQAGIQTLVSQNIKGDIWDKLLVNVGINALSGITELENGKLLHFPEIQQLLELAVKEGEKVAHAKGIKLNVADPIKHTKEICKATAANKSSMLQDLLNGYPTEIEKINGAIVTEGLKFNIEVPINLALTNLIKFKEASNEYKM